MPNKLSFLSRDQFTKAFEEIDRNHYPKDHEWNLYWINFDSKYYPFKYTVELASSIAGKQLKTGGFRSNPTYRKHVAQLGFPVQYRAPVKNTEPVRHFVAATYFGKEPNLIPKLDEFIKNGYWQTDHSDDYPTGKRVFKTLSSIKVNDRIALRFLSRKNRTVEIKALGTITDVNKASAGILSVTWDERFEFYKGDVPDGPGAGNWMDTLIEIRRPEDVELIFGLVNYNRRACRLTYNDLGYILPSGRQGKSKNQKSHEGLHGYGHEEWLFDISKLIDGYHYGFLEPIRKHQNSYLNKVFDVWMYTINAEAKQRYYVGEIKNVEVITRELASQVKNYYKGSGWLKTMEDQIRSCGANETGFSNYQGLDIFNIRFKARDLFVPEDYIVIHEANPIWKFGRYSLLSMRDDFEVPAKGYNGEFSFQKPDLSDIDESNNPKRVLSIREPKSVEITYLHESISKHLTKILRVQHKPEDVYAEHPAGYGRNRIDIVVNAPEGFTFYEIKTYNSLMNSIREAMGQLMEYALWPGVQKAMKMVIVSHNLITEEAIAYLKYLRNCHKLPIYYQSYDIEHKTLSDFF